MMKKLSYALTFATIAVTILFASSVAANNKQDKDKMSEGMMDMSAMMNEPHHQLAMAYKENMVNFAKALQLATANTTTVDAPFARVVVTEMRRSFDQMQEHHHSHMKLMDEKMKMNMADMMKTMETQVGAIKDDLAALEKEVQASAPDSKNISKYVEDLLKNCDSMSKMHDDKMEHKMGAPNEHKLN